MSRALARVGDIALYTQLRARGFRSRQIPTGLGPVHMLDAKGRGARPPVLLLHGLGSQATDWGPFLHRLRKASRRVYVIDLPGHGRSKRALKGSLSALFAHAGELLNGIDEPPVVVGNSLGGMTAVRALQGAECRGLVLLSPGGAPMSQAEMDTTFAPFTQPSYRRTLAFIDGVMQRRIWYRRVMARALHGRLAGSPIQRIVGDATPEDLLQPQELQAITAPTLLIWGDKDQLLPRAGLDFFLEHLPQVECMRPAHVGHAPHVDDPRWVAEQVIAFMDRLG